MALTCHHVLLVSAMWSIIFLTSFIIKSMGVLLPVLLEQFNTGTKNIGTVVSLLYFTGHLIGLSSHVLTRIFGARLVVMTCGLLASAGLFLGSLANNLLVLVLGMILTGMAFMGNTISTGLISTYFTIYYNVVTNIITTAVPLAIMVSASLTQLILDCYGWRGAMMLLSAMMLHYTVAATMMKPVKNTSPEYQSLSEKKRPEERSCFKSIFNPTLLTNAQFIFVLAISVCSAYMLNGWVVYLVSISQSKGLSPTNAANVATISGVGALLVRVLLATIQGKSSNYRLLFFIGALTMMLAYTGMLFVTSYLLMSVCSFVLGVSYGILGSQIYNAALSAVERDNSVGAIAWVNVSNGVGYIASGYISGLLYDINGTFYLTLISQCVISCVIIVILTVGYVASLFASKKEGYCASPFASKKGACEAKQTQTRSVLGGNQSPANPHIFHRASLSIRSLYKRYT